MIVAFSASAVGTLLAWPCYTPAHPYLSLIPAMLLGAGSAAAYVFVNAMLPDVVDMDEMKTGQRREGMFSAVYSSMFKIGAAIGPLLGGYMLRGTGFNANLGAQLPETIFRMRVCYTAIPTIALIAAIALLLMYPGSEKKSYEIRRQLEIKRKESRETVG